MQEGDLKEADWRRFLDLVESHAGKNGYRYSDGYLQILQWDGYDPEPIWELKVDPRSLQRWLRGEKPRGGFRSSARRRETAWRSVHDGMEIATGYPPERGPFEVTRRGIRPVDPSRTMNPSD